MILQLLLRVLLVFIFSCGFILPYAKAQLVNQGGLVSVAPSAIIKVNSEDLVNSGTTANFVNQGKVSVVGNYRNISGAQFVNNDSLIVSEDFIDSASYTFSTGLGTLLLVSPIVRQFISRGQFQKFNHVVLAGGGAKNFSGLAAVNGTFSFVDGVIFVGDTDTLGIDSSGFTPLTGTGSASSSSYVSGRLFRRATGADVYFPVGKGGNFRPANLKNVPLVSPKPLMALQVRNISFGASGPNIALGAPNPDFGLHWKMAADAQYQGSPIELGFKNADFTAAFNSAELVVGQTDSIGASIKWKGIGGTNFQAGTINRLTSAYNATEKFYTLGFCKNLQLNVTAWLQGPYNTGSGLMDPTDFDTLTKMYGINGSLLQMYAGTTVPTGAVDVMTVYLRTGAFGAFVDSISCWLMTDGSIRDFYTGSQSFVTFCTTNPGNYRVVLKHRNHLAIMSSNDAGLVSGSPATMNMTGIASIYGGGAYPLAPLKYGMLAGNARNLDQEINAWDLYQVVKAQNLLTPGYKGTDVNLDLVTNASDFNITSNANSNLFFSTVP